MLDHAIPDLHHANVRKGEVCVPNDAHMEGKREHERIDQGHGIGRTEATDSQKPAQVPPVHGESPPIRPHSRQCRAGRRAAPPRKQSPCINGEQLRTSRVPEMHRFHNVLLATNVGCRQAPRDRPISCSDPLRGSSRPPKPAPGRHGPVTCTFDPPGRDACTP